MKFLIDNQLPRSLRSYLESRGYASLHVSEFDLLSDAEIWQYATVQNLIILTKDEDFFLLSKHKEEGPQVVWIRIGNCRNAQLLEAFDRILKTLVEGLAAGTRIIEIR